uniref:Uncharacterized protein n=1 Tax=Ananas comosus var. bracteatus TaxID=296719 RepID=A0A6V7NEM2_ANACO|nr:unnamed protein product [Ananas comosus var. bracteatus]
MVAAPVNNEETQILDSDSLRSVPFLIMGFGRQFWDFSDPETRFDGAERNVVGAVDVGNGDLVKESGVLYGETQALDDSEGSGGDGISMLRKAEEDAELGLETAKDENLSSGDGKDENLVDSDASTDDEEGGEVRVASIRSSALAAAQNFLSKSRNTDSRSTCSNDSTNKTEAIRLTTPMNSHSAIAKRDLQTKEEENTSKMESTHLPAIGHGIAGLSYVGSQEPGDLSQANALEVVDKFISINDLEPSQEDLNRGKAAVLKSPPISSAKGVRFLAEKVDHSKVDASKSQSHPPKNRSGVYDKSGKEDDASPNTVKLKSLEKQVEGNYDIGPDTQMAAEAIQILVHGSPIRHTAEVINNVET